MIPEESRNPDVRSETAVPVKHTAVPTTSNSNVYRQHVRVCTSALPHGYCSTVIVHSLTVKRYPYMQHATRVTIVASHPAPESHFDNRGTQQQLSGSKHEELSIVRTKKRLRETYTQNSTTNSPRVWRIHIASRIVAGISQLKKLICGEIRLCRTQSTRDAWEEQDGIPSAVVAWRSPPSVLGCRGRFALRI